jgi:hypothetical protein
MGWIMGYLSAYNVFVAAKLDELYSAAIEGADQETRHEQHETYAKIPPIDIMGDLKGEQVFAWSDQYCATYPLENLHKAMRALIWELENRSERSHELPAEK